MDLRFRCRQFSLKTISSVMFAVALEREPEIRPCHSTWDLLVGQHEELHCRSSGECCGAWVGKGDSIVLSDYNGGGWQPSVPGTQESAIVLSCPADLSEGVTGIDLAIEPFVPNIHPKTAPSPSSRCSILLRSMNCRLFSYSDVINSNDILP